MPIFDYLCDDCGTKFEKLVLPQFKEPVVCPSCGHDRVTQQLSTFLAPTPGKVKPPVGHSKEHDTPSYGHDD